MTLAYHFSSLAHLARMFEEKASDTRRKAQTIEAKSERRSLEREAFAWEQAADIVRRAVIDGVSP